jgi:trimethylamine--corrinoid protein Co-methyltransferase
MMGGTSPQSFAGSLVQWNAEVLTGLVLTQRVNKGAPFIHGSMPSIINMKSTTGSYGAVMKELDEYCRGQVARCS